MVKECYKIYTDDSDKLYYRRCFTQFENITDIYNISLDNVDFSKIKKIHIYNKTPVYRNLLRDWCTNTNRKICNNPDKADITFILNPESKLFNRYYCSIYKINQDVSNYLDVVYGFKIPTGSQVSIRNAYNKIGQSIIDIFKRNNLESAPSHVYEPVDDKDLSRRFADVQLLYYQLFGFGTKLDNTKITEIRKLCNSDVNNLDIGLSILCGSNINDSLSEVLDLISDIISLIFNNCLHTKINIKTLLTYLDIDRHTVVDSDHKIKVLMSKNLLTINHIKKYVKTYRSAYEIDNSPYFEVKSITLSEKGVNYFKDYYENSSE